jgi:hypothetical protein
LTLLFGAVTKANQQGQTTFEPPTAQLQALQAGATFTIQFSLGLAQ